MGRAEPGGVLAARYRLREVLRRDEMGIVWLARDGLRHRDVAVRAVPVPPLPGDADQEPPHQRMLRDARALARLDHPNIPVVFDIVEGDDGTWMVLQAAPYRSPYRSLGDVVRNHGPLPPQRAAEAGFQVLSALRAAHAVGVQHGDVRPGNVLLGPGNWAMLTGFGMVTAGDGRAAEAPAGSPCYLAPERAGGQPATPAADLWSLGATLYLAVEGRPPFDGDGQAAVRTAVASGYPDPPRRAGPLWPVISGLLRNDPGARPDAAGVDWLLRRVAGVRDAAGPVPPAEPAGPPPGAAPARGGPPAASRDGAGPAMTASAPGAGATGDRQADAAADFIPGFGPRGPEPDGDAPEREGSRPGEAPRGGGRRRRRWLFAVTGGAAMVAAAAAAIVATVPGSTRAPGHPLAAAGLGAGAAARQTGAPAAPDAARARRGPQPGPAARGPARTASPAPGTGVLPAGFSWYRDPAGFSIGVPPGWHVSRQGHRVYVRDPHSRRVLAIAWTTHPRPHPLADWRRQEAARIAGYPGYHRIRLAAVRYGPAERAADWAFTYYRNGQLTRVLRRNILASARHGYAMDWSVPAPRWRGSFHYFRAFAATFRPAGGVQEG